MQPFTSDEVNAIVKAYLDTNSPTDINKLVAHLLQELRARTTDYKVIASATLLSQNTDESKHSVGFLWNDDTDGHYALKFDTNDAWLLVSVSYIKL